jgi:hypothetical protein
MARKNNLDKFRDVMYTDVNNLEGFTQAEIEQLLRYRFAFTSCLNNPSVPDTTLRDELMVKFNISQSQAYRDIFNIKILLPSIRNAGKQWARYLVEEELKQAIADAKTMADECTDYKLKAYFLEIRTKAIDKMGKYTRLDKEDELNIDWDDIVPIPIEPTNDVSVLQVKPLANKQEEIKKLYEKYKGEIEIEDIDYEDVKDDERD